jgi:hypothetical protein
MRKKGKRLTRSNEERKREAQRQNCGENDGRKRTQRGEKIEFKQRKGKN